MTTGNTEWKRFCESSARVMQDFRDGKMTLEQAWEFFESDHTISDPELREHIENTICEIGGSPGYYEELLHLFEVGATETELRENYLNAPYWYPGKALVQFCKRLFKM